MIAAPSATVDEYGTSAWRIAAAITNVSRIGEDCSAIVMPWAGQRSNRDRAPIAAPNNRAKASVAQSAPAISTRELTTPSRKSDQAGTVSSIGNSRSNPVNPANQVSKALTSLANGVGCNSASAGGETQAGLVLPVSLLHSGRSHKACCCTRKPAQ